MARDDKVIAEFRRVLLDAEARRMAIASGTRWNRYAGASAALSSAAFLLSQMALIVGEIAVPWWVQDFLLYGAATAWPFACLTTSRLNLLYAFEALETSRGGEAR